MLPTGTIDARRINITANLTVSGDTNILGVASASSVFTTNLTATNISTNILTASQLNLTNLTASNISTNILTASQLNTINFTATNISTSILTASTGSIAILTSSEIDTDSITIRTASGDNTISKNLFVSGFSYSGISFLVSGQETSPQGVFFSPEGQYMFITGSSGDDITQYSLSTPWIVSTAALYTTSFNVGDSSPTDLFFKDDGTRVYVLGGTSDVVREFRLTTPWNVSPGSMTFSTSFSVVNQDSGATGLAFNNDGTKMFMVGTTNDRVHEYSLGTAWSSSTAVYASVSRSLSPSNSPQAVNFNSDGTKMFILDNNLDSIFEFELSVPFTITSSVVKSAFPVLFEESSALGMYTNLNSTASYTYVVGSTNDTVYQYANNARSIINVGNFAVDGNLNVRGNLFTYNPVRMNSTLSVHSGITTDGASTFNDTLTANASLSLNGAADSTANIGTAVRSANINIGTGITTGSILIGGPTQSSTIVIGRSTNSYTVSIAVGTVSANLKQTIEIGTRGLSGSITDIVMGSTTAGALGTATFNIDTIMNKKLTLSADPTSNLEAATKQYVDNNAGGKAFATISVSGQNNLVAASTNSILTVAAGTNITLSTDNATNTLTINSSAGGTAATAFGIISIPGADTVSADSSSDTLTINAGNGIIITSSATIDFITIGTNGTSSNTPNTLVLRDAGGGFSTSNIIVEALTSSTLNTTILTSSNISSNILTSSFINTSILTSSNISSNILTSSFINSSILTSSNISSNVLTSSTLNATILYVGTGSTVTASIAAFNDTNTGIYFPDADQIGFIEGGIEVMRINSSSNIGIGTRTPSTKLEVSGNISATAFISTVASGVPPFTVSSTTSIVNLNADLLDGQHASYFVNRSVGAIVYSYQNFGGAL
jgi:sugar lactone lactonase YvrE